MTPGGDTTLTQRAYSEYSHGDPTIAFRLMLRCAIRSDPKATFLVGVMYARGQGVRQSSRHAQRWFSRLEKQAASGCAAAQWCLSNKLRWGNFFPTDRDRANELLVAAAYGGNADAQGFLAEYLWYGLEGFKIDQSEAMTLLRSSLEHGSVEGLGLAEAVPEALAQVIDTGQVLSLRAAVAALGRPIS